MARKICMSFDFLNSIFEGNSLEYREMAQKESRSDHMSGTSVSFREDSTIYKIGIAGLTIYCSVKSQAPDVQ